MTNKIKWKRLNEVYKYDDFHITDEGYYNDELVFVIGIRGDFCSTGNWEAFGAHPNSNCLGVHKKLNALKMTVEKLHNKG